MTLRTPSARNPAEPIRAIGFADAIARLRRALRRAARAADPANTLAVAQFELLACLADNPDIRPGHLAKLLNLRPNTVTTLVNALAQLDMVERSAATDDGRSIRLTLTDEGRHAVHAWQATNNAVLDLALSALTSAERSALTRAVPALGALAVAIDQLAASAELPGMRAR
jgi:DNA-binding MarR family transcriptional regulator